MSSSHLVVSLTYSAVGFAAGYLAGRVGRDVGQRGTTGEPRWWHVTRTLLGLLLVVLVASSVTASYAAVTQQRRVTECQAQFNQAYALALGEQRAAAASERQAQRVFLSSVLNPTGRAEAYRVYLASLDAADRRRDENPLPKSAACPP